MQSDTQDTTLEDKTPEDEADETTQIVDGEAMVRAIEERRKSYLDHHWAVPKQSLDQEKEEEEKHDSLLDQGTYINRLDLFLKI